MNNDRAVIHLFEEIEELKAILASERRITNNLRSAIEAKDSTIGALKDTVDCLQKSLQSSVPRHKYEELKDRLQSSNEYWERNQDYWFDETRKAEAERDKLKQDLELSQSLARQIITGLSKKS